MFLDCSIYQLAGRLVCRPKDRGASLMRGPRTLCLPAAWGAVRNARAVQAARAVIVFTIDAARDAAWAAKKRKAGGWLGRG